MFAGLLVVAATVHRFAPLETLHEVGAGRSIVLDPVGPPQSVLLASAAKRLRKLTAGEIPFKIVRATVVRDLPVIAASESELSAPSESRAEMAAVVAAVVRERPVKTVTIEPPANDQHEAANSSRQPATVSHDTSEPSKTEPDARDATTLDVPILKPPTPHDAEPLAGQKSRADRKPANAKRPAAAEGASANVSKADAKPEDAGSDEKANDPNPISKRGVVTGETYTVVNEWTDDEIASGRNDCRAAFADGDIVAKEVAPFREGACGAPAPIQVSAVGNPRVAINPPATMTCAMAQALKAWVVGKVQPEAQAHFGKAVSKIESASTYVCRNRYGRADAPLSEHALANALDMSGFVLTDGRTIRVLQDWGHVARDVTGDRKPDAAPANLPKVSENNSRAVSKAGLSMLGAAPAKTLPAATDGEQSGKSLFLHTVHDQACEIFGTVLGPEANDAHRNHFHLDMKARRHTSFCQ